MNLKPVGFVKNPLKTQSLGATKDNLTLKASMEELKKQQKEIETTLNDILIFEPWHQLLKGIEAFSHIDIEVIYHGLTLTQILKDDEKLITI